MTINTRRVTDRVRQRIRSSEYRLTVVYPLLVSKPTGVSPISLPVSPLMRTPNPTPENDEYKERVQPEVTMPCLFTEVSLIGDLRKDRLSAEVGGWTRETTAVARVDTADADSPTGGTVFDGCDHVEVEGRRYKVLNVVRQAAGTTRDGTYYVLLQGALKS